MEEKDILTYDNLYFTALKCAKGVNWKPSVAHYMLNLPEETLKLYTELSSGTYKERPHRVFKIYEPKEREVLSICFRDRVYQRTLNDFIIYPLMTKSFIADNCASQKGKGTDYARDRLKYKMRSFYQRNKSNDGYIIHLDIRKYYPSMRHSEALALLKKKLPEWLYLRTEEMLKAYDGDVGYNPGSQLVQILGIAMLDGVDHFIKEKLRVKEYIRYMDDLILIVKDNPEYYVSEIEKELNKLGFSLHSEKSRYFALCEGCAFLGFKFSLGDTGKVYMCISNRNIKRRKRKIRKTVGKATLKEFETSFNTWLSYAEKTTNKSVLDGVIRYYNFYKEKYYDIKIKAETDTAGH